MSGQQLHTRDDCAALWWTAGINRGGTSVLGVALMSGLARCFATWNMGRNFLPRPHMRVDWVRTTPYEAKDYQPLLCAFAACQAH